MQVDESSREPPLGEQFEVDPDGRLLAVGAILLHSEPVEPHSSLAVEGARTTAAMAAGRYGAVLKVSEDGLITFYDHMERIWDI